MPLQVGHTNTTLKCPIGLTRDLPGIWLVLVVAASDCLCYVTGRIREPKRTTRTAAAYGSGQEVKQIDAFDGVVV